MLCAVNLCFVAKNRPHWRNDRTGPAEKPSDKYYKAAQLADALSRDLHYTVDEKQKAVLITDDGYEAAEDVLEAREERATSSVDKQHVLFSALPEVTSYEAQTKTSCFS